MRLKIIRFIHYDVNEGLFRFWKRYLLIVLLGIIIGIMFNKEAQRVLYLYRSSWSPLEYGIREFWGRYPFHYDPNATEIFILPFEWILEYLILAYCIGSYIRDDMEGYGAQLMLKSGQRYIWWGSKSIWCILVNVTYFGLLWGVNIAYAWIVSGDISFVKNKFVLESFYGSMVADTPVKELLFFTLLLPFMVGVVQSLFQMIGSICLGSTFTMALLTGLLVLSSYYANPLLVHGYAMVIRYYPDSSHPTYRALDYRFGSIYLGILIMLLIFIGYTVVRKKDILSKE